MAQAFTELVPGESQQTAWERLQNNDLALVTLHSGAVEPSNPYPHMLWQDTSANVVKQRNAGNTAWVELWGSGERIDWFAPSVFLGGLSGSVDTILWTPPRNAKVIRAFLVSDTATTGSDGTDNWTFMLRVPGGDDLISAVVSTEDTEITADTPYLIDTDQNEEQAAFTAIELSITKNNSPTDLSSARIVVGLHAHGVA
jgi:hypothetical protein